jgi:CHAT domain-containing protein
VNQRSLRGADASSEIVLQQAPAYNLFHFCCHGRADLLEPLNSGLMMAFGQTVSLRDLLEIRLPATRLAVLSACETGVPGTRLPDEVIGLPAGFLRAGVGGVAASLWAVADESTMELMSRFYDFWRKKKLEPAEALCRAQQAVRDSERAPSSIPSFGRRSPIRVVREECGRFQRGFALPRISPSAKISRTRAASAVEVKGLAK